MPYRPTKTMRSTALKTPLAAKLSAKPATGAWVHDHKTGDTTYTANPDRYLDNPLEHEGKPRFKVLWGKRNPSARNEIKRKPRKRKPTLYPIAGADPSIDGKPSTAQAMMVDARLINSDPYFNIKQIVRDQTDFNKARALADYQRMAWFFIK